MLGLLVLGGLGYWFWKTRTDAPPVDYTMTVPKDGQHGQPSQLSPVRKYIYDERQDTANQPWFGGSTQFQDAEPSTNPIADSVADLWWELDNHNTIGTKDPYALVPIVGEETKQAYTTDVQIFSKAGS